MNRLACAVYLEAFTIALEAARAGTAATFNVLAVGLAPGTLQFKRRGGRA